MSRGTGTTATPTNQGRSIGTRSTNLWRRSSISTSPATPTSTIASSSSVAATQVSSAFSLHPHLPDQISRCLIAQEKFICKTQPSAKGWLMMDTMMWLVLTFPLWSSKLCRTSTLTVHTSNVSPLLLKFALFFFYLFIYFCSVCSDFFIINNLLDLQMDVRDMSAFQTDSFDAVVDKGASFLRSRLHT